MARVLELFSGIGGWRLSLPEELAVDEIVAYDSDKNCSAIYQKNFMDAVLLRNIEQLTLPELSGFDIWLMSPPCQPFTATKNASQKDVDDTRCKALLHLAAQLPLLDKKPMHIALENVKGFYHSQALTVWTLALKEAGYTYKQFLIDPAELGIPNHRKRYYLIAERSDRFRTEQDIVGTLPPFALREIPLQDKLKVEGNADWMRSIVEDVEKTNAECRKSQNFEAKDALFSAMRTRVGAAFSDALQLNAEFHTLWSDGRFSVLPSASTEASHNTAALSTTTATKTPTTIPSIILSFESGDHDCLRQLLLAQKEVSHLTTMVGKPIGDYVDRTMNNTECWLPTEVLAKPYARGLSYVSDDIHRSFCFTGHYGKVMHKSSGSLYYTAPEGRILDKTKLPEFHGTLRLFTPREVLNFLGFPTRFTLPSADDMPLHRQYKAVGNSISITVTTQLLALLLR